VAAVDRQEEGGRSSVPDGSAHTPQDEFREDWNFSGYPVLIRFAFDIARMAANAKDLPTWLPGDEFRPARERSGVK